MIHSFVQVGRIDHGEPAGTRTRKEAAEKINALNANDANENADIALDAELSFEFLEVDESMAVDSQIFTDDMTNWPF